MDAFDKVFKFLKMVKSWQGTVECDMLIITCSREYAENTVFFKEINKRCKYNPDLEVYKITFDNLLYILGEFTIDDSFALTPTDKLFLNELYISFKKSVVALDS